MTAKSYGPIVQNAWVVKDMDAGIDYWTTQMRVGPFFKFPKITAETSFYRGESVDLDFEAAMAYSGDLCVELIKPNGPSIFMEFLNAGGKGVQHLCAMTDDMEAASAEITASGGKAVQGATFADGSSVRYFDMGGVDPVILEIAQLMPDVKGLFAAIREAGLAWDGKTRLVSF